jgi:uncharacterized protein YkwD
MQADNYVAIQVTDMAATTTTTHTRDDTRDDTFDAMRGVGIDAAARCLIALALKALTSAMS